MDGGDERQEAQVAGQGVVGALPFDESQIQTL